MQNQRTMLGRCHLGIGLQMASVERESFEFVFMMPIRIGSAWRLERWASDSGHHSSWICSCS